MLHLELILGISAYIMHIVKRTVTLYAISAQPRQMNNKRLHWRRKQHVNCAWRNCLQSAWQYLGSVTCTSSGSFVACIRRRRCRQRAEADVFRRRISITWSRRLYYAAVLCCMTACSLRQFLRPSEFGQEIFQQSVLGGRRRDVPSRHAVHIWTTAPCSPLPHNASTIC